MARREIDAFWDRKTRNDLNENFKELYNEYREAGFNAEKAREKAHEAVMKSDEAMALSERTQKELSQAILEGDSSPLGGQLSVGADGTIYSNPQERLVTEFNSVNQKLAQSEAEIKKVRQNHTERKPTFALIDDDGHKDVMSKLKPMLESRGVKGTLAIATSFTDNDPNFLTSDQVKEMHENGWEIVNHCHTNVRLANVTESEIRYEFETSQRILKSLGIETDVLVYPGGSYNQQVVDIAKDYFSVAVDDDSGRNSYPLATYSIKRIGIGPWGQRDFSVIKSLIDGAFENNELCVLMTHIGQHTSEDDLLLENVLDYILDNGGEIKTFSEAYDEHKNILEYGRFNVMNDSSELVVDIDGNLIVEGTEYAQSFTYMNENISADAPPSSYKQGITLKIYQDSEATTLPSGGTVITCIVNPTNHRYNFQLFKPYGNNTHQIRTGLSSSEWSAWSDDKNKNLIINPSLPADAPPSAYNLGITVKLYTNAEASSLPNGNGGTVTTYIVTDGDYKYNYQEYKQYGGVDKYIRTALSGSEWSAWREYSIN